MKKFRKKVSITAICVIVAAVVIAGGILAYQYSVSVEISDKEKIVSVIKQYYSDDEAAKDWDMETLSVVKIQVPETTKQFFAVLHKDAKNITGISLFKKNRIFTGRYNYIGGKCGVSAGQIIDPHIEFEGWNVWALGGIQLEDDIYLYQDAKGQAAAGAISDEIFLTVTAEQDR